MIDFIYDQVAFDFSFQKNDVGKAEWLLKQDPKSNVFFTDIGIDKGILGNSEFALTVESVNDYFSSYLIKFGLASAVSRKENFDKIKGLLNLEFIL